MLTIRDIHAVFGERILPVLIVLAAIWFTVSWKPETPRSLPARILPILVDTQFLLGLIYWIFGIALMGRLDFLGFPFILHPILGLAAVVVVHNAVKPHSFLSKLGRWAPLASLGVLFLIVFGGILIARPEIRQAFFM